MLTVVTAAVIGRSCLADNKVDIESWSSSSRGIFDNRTRHPHGNSFEHGGQPTFYTGSVILKNSIGCVHLLHHGPL